VDLLVPVPAHPARVRERGLDVTGEWCARLGRLEALPTARALLRRRATPPQVGRDRVLRRVNVAGAFAPGPQAAAARGRRVVVVDDVVTTGATVRACAELLGALGARQVTAWALAYEPLE
jgi:predicted amidophosphoribosyltransferase